MSTTHDRSSNQDAASSKLRTVERVFPIRIRASTRPASVASPRIQTTTASPDEHPIVTTQTLVGLDSENEPLQVPGAAEPAQPFIATAPLTPPTPPSFNDTTAPFISTTQLASESLEPTEDLLSGGRYITQRFSYLPSSATGNSVESGPPQFASSPQSRKIYRCEDEPIHIPGAIQSFGALIALRQEDNGDFVVRIASENSKDVTGVDPESLFSLQCFTDALTVDDKKEFLVRVQGMHTNCLGMVPDVFTVSLISQTGAAIPLFCAIHRSEESNLVICEFEPVKDVFRPQHPPDDGLPNEAAHVLDIQEPDPEAYSASTVSKSKPLHAVNIARKTSRPLGSMELFHVLCEIQAQMATTTELPELLDIIVGLVYELTSLHRVMVYQFDETAAGSVRSELVDIRASTDLYRGLHFPASDIPPQARALYKLNTIRVLYDRTDETARLVCRDLDDAKVPLNLKNSYLRSMSPIHLKYLANMGVRASMSISLMVHGELWGLISCHNYGNGSKISLPLRELCRGLGHIAGSNIERVIYASRIRARKILSNAPPKTSPSAYVAASSSDLLSMFEADLGFLVIKGEARTIGKLFAYNECIALLNYIRQRALASIFSSNAIQRDCEDVDLTEELSTINGLLIIPLAHSGADFLVFFRKSKQKNIQWAGNPYEKNIPMDGNYLEPRSSFKRWSENVVGTSKEWTEEQIESATVLSTLYGRFIEVWRQKEAIVQKNRMTRVLIRNAGHEVRTPLNSVINYLEMALEENLDEGARQHLQKSLQASKSLVFVVNDLLNLTEVEDVDFRLHEEEISVAALIEEALSAFKEEANRKEIKLEGIYPTPSTISCDPEALRQVIFNLLANALQNSVSGTVTVHLKHQNSTELTSTIEISIQDEGAGLSESELDAIFQDFEKVLDDDNGHQNAGQETILSPRGASTKAAEIGLGLAVTARFVRHNFGQIRISSPGKGKGTLVSVKIPFRKPIKRPHTRKNSTSSFGLSLPTPPEIPLHLPFRGSRLQTQLALSELRHDTSSNSSVQSPDVFSPDQLAMASPSIIDRYPFPNSIPPPVYRKFNVLVAEDNPLNSRLLEARLGRKGHGVTITVNGRACFDAFKKTPEAFDIVLMDIQMPIVDGIQSTLLIRTFENSLAMLSSTDSPAAPDAQPKVTFSAAATAYGRIPIIAVSASISESNRQLYIDAGFDGWIVKPVDFKRLEDVLKAIVDLDVRRTMYYGNERWERGGWFARPGEDSDEDDEVAVAAADVDDETSVPAVLET